MVPTKHTSKTRKCGSFLQKNNPEAFRNVVKRMLEGTMAVCGAAPLDTIEKLKKMYGDAEDRIEGVL